MTGAIITINEINRPSITAPIAGTGKIARFDKLTAAVYLQLNTEDVETPETCE